MNNRKKKKASDKVLDSSDNKLHQWLLACSLKKVAPGYSVCHNADAIKISWVKPRQIFENKIRQRYYSLGQKKYLSSYKLTQIP